LHDVPPEKASVVRLAEVRLERFKAAFLPPPIPLRGFNVVIGRNGSGKSTLLEALQWLDATIRRDAREASDRYFGVGDLVNLRSRVDVPYFAIGLTWALADSRELRYDVRVQVSGDGLPIIASEHLDLIDDSGAVIKSFVTTETRGQRAIVDTGVVVRDPDRLALGVLGSLAGEGADPVLSDLADFWTRAVFLRLSPNRLAVGSPAVRRSFEPMLDEEGQKLPALLYELSDQEREDLVAALRSILPDIRDVQIETAGLDSNTRVTYSLMERMPYRGRTGRWQFPIPAWMLSEGTRRLTAVLALTVKRPGPSLLCIEEIENGLDPWTVREVLRALEDLSEGDTQVIVTSHSPWLLDDTPLDAIIHVRREEGDTIYKKFADRDEVREFSESIPPGTRYVHAGG
jgi:energy-coupling factor transporter ATP-binding protein EcfA2